MITACKVPVDGKDGVCVNLEKDVVHCPTLRSHLLDKNFTDIHSAICEEHNEPHLNRTRVRLIVSVILFNKFTFANSYEGLKN